MNGRFKIAMGLVFAAMSLLVIGSVLAFNVSDITVSWNGTEPIVCPEEIDLGSRWPGDEVTRTIEVENISPNDLDIEMKIKYEGEVDLHLDPVTFIAKANDIALVELTIEFPTTWEPEEESATITCVRK